MATDDPLRSPLFDLPDEIHRLIVRELDVSGAASLRMVSKGGSNMVRMHAPPAMEFILAHGAESPARAARACRQDVFELIRTDGTDLGARLPVTQGCIETLTLVLWLSRDAARTSAAVATAKYILQSWPHFEVPLAMVKYAYFKNRIDLLFVVMDVGRNIHRRNEGAEWLAALERF